MLYAVFKSFSLAEYLAGYPAFLITGYPAAVSGIRPDTGFKKRLDYPASRISGASLIWTDLKKFFGLICFGCILLTKNKMKNYKILPVDN